MVFWWPNTNTNIIRFPKNYRIQIRILFGFPKMTEYKYEYYLAFQKWLDTNTNIIQLSTNDRIRISFGFRKKFIIWSLKAHFKIHSGEKLNKCEHCEYAVLHAYHSRVHLKVNTHCHFVTFDISWHLTFHAKYIYYSEKNRIRIRFGLRKSPEYE